MNSPVRFRASPRDGCAPNAQLFIELEEPSGARYAFAEQPFQSRSSPIHTAESTQQLSYALNHAGRFSPGDWNLTLTWKHYPNGIYTRCIGEIRLNTASLEARVRPDD